MKLNPEYNYIVSGLERSGTSMLMQALYAGGFPIAFDESRKPDENNPKGYFELEGGKIINRLMEGTFPFEKYRGIFIKITAYGLKFLPTGRYKVIYSERDIEEILDSMEKMMGGKDKDREETRRAFLHLNSTVKKMMIEREDVDILFVNYNEIILDPRPYMEEITSFIGCEDADVDAMVQSVDRRLYRQRRIA
ncbi:MAG: nucleotide pyrophosphatase [Thermoplasmata archaeon]|nr:MAG: nucleotide pyrophosphatase [Thermoplasmata archaeon]